MNWRRGFVRLWIVLSLVWVTATLSFGIAFRILPNWSNPWRTELAKEVEGCKTGRNPFDCFGGRVISAKECAEIDPGPGCDYWPAGGIVLEKLDLQRNENFKSASVETAVIVLVPPIFSLVFGILLLWILRGFIG